MEKYFGLHFEFNQIVVNQIIEHAIENQIMGYVCIVDGNVLAYSKNNPHYREIINNSLVNLCDGSSIAKLAGLIHKKKLQTYRGPEVFSFFIQKKVTQILLGNTNEILMKLCSKLETNGINTHLMHFCPLPFSDIDGFDYKSIAEKVNFLSPDIVWVSLGAPKQEIFISRLMPYLKYGVVVAVGAAFNLYLNDSTNRRAPLWMRKIHMEWLFRSLQEPRRVGKRATHYAIVLPRLIIDEIKMRKHNTNI